MRIAEAFKDATNRLRAAGIDSARLDARLLLARAVGGPTTVVLSAREETLSAAQESVFHDLLRRRLAFEPMAYILGEREFWSLPFKVTPDTLIPRGDSETLIEAVLNDGASWTHEDVRILDIGTGSGCLMLTLLDAWPHAVGLGLDISAGALAVATENARNLGLGGRAEFVLGDAFAPGALTRLTQEGAFRASPPFTCIVANPPYIPEAQIAMLDPDVRDYEPHAALNGGVDGLDAYRALLAQAKGVLRQDGALYLEVGEGQDRDVAILAREHGWDVSGVHNDIASVARCVVLHPRVKRRASSPQVS